MRNTDEVLDILEEKLTQALNRLKISEYDNSQLKSELSGIKIKAGDYEKQQVEKEQLEKRLAVLGDAENKIKSLEIENAKLLRKSDELKNIEVEYYKLKSKQDSSVAMLKEEQQKIENYKSIIVNLKEENEKLRHVKDSVRDRVVQLIARLEDDDVINLSTEATNTPNNINDKGSQEIKAEIDFYKDSGSKVIIDNDKGNDINFFVEDVESGDSEDNSKDKIDGEGQGDLF